MPKSSGENNLPPLLFILDKTPKRNQILVGDDPAQVRFAEKILSSFHNFSLECQPAENVTDVHIVGKDSPQLYRVTQAGMIELSQQGRDTCDIWSLAMIEPNSAAAFVLVKHAAKLIGIDKPKREIVTKISSEVTKDGVYNIFAALWQAAWMLSQPQQETKQWSRPWESSLEWLPRGEDPAYRLNSLYWELLTYVFAKEDDEAGLKKALASGNKKFYPDTFKRLSKLNLSNSRVFSTFEELSIWRNKHTDPFVCALKIANIWD
jgi:hypothetical protein